MEGKKILQEMTLEELWHLFPITLEPYNPSWPQWADDEINHLNGLLGQYDPHITHIGSTAVPNLIAKPIVDILVETDSSDAWDRVINIMEGSGYIMMARNNERMSFNKGYTPDGYAERVFHIHFRLTGENKEILFRDCLRQDAGLARAYEKLKLSLLPEYKNNRDGYTSAKSEFINSVLSEAEKMNCETTSLHQMRRILSGRIGLKDVKSCAVLASSSPQNREFLWRMTSSDDRRMSVNSLWVMTHLDITELSWIESLQDIIIRRLLVEKDTSRKRLFLQLLRKQIFSSDSPLIVELLEYCFSRINSECEPYAVRCFSIYVAFNICRVYPDLIAELEEYLNLLDFQSLSPGLRSALRQTRKKITKLKKEFK